MDAEALLRLTMRTLTQRLDRQGNNEKLRQLFLAPVVCQLQTGELHYDNFGGRWGQQQELDQFLQAYAVEKSTHSQCTSCYGFCHLGKRGISLHLRIAL